MGNGAQRPRHAPEGARFQLVDARPGRHDGSFQVMRMRVGGFAQGFQLGGRVLVHAVIGFALQRHVVEGVACVANCLIAIAQRLIEIDQRLVDC